MADQPARRSRKEQAARTQATLKAAAKRVFDRRGYLNTKITDITAEAGRAAGSFYNHFSSKEELLEALLTDLIEQADTAVVDDAEHEDDFSQRSAIRWHVAGFWNLLRAHRTEMVALSQAALVDERFAARLRTLLRPDIGHLAAHLDQVRLAGGTLPGDPRLVAAAISGMLWQFGHQWSQDTSLTGREVPDDEAIEMLTDLIHRGVAGGTS